MYIDNTEGSERPLRSIEDCTALIARLLEPPGRLLREFAPGGWVRSPLMRLFHPTRAQAASALEQGAACIRQMHRKPRADHNAESMATGARKIEPRREVVELLGRALCDVFNCDNAVIDRHGNEFLVGWHREAAGFIADTINRVCPVDGHAYTHSDLYSGTRLLRHLADVSPVHRWIFRRLRAANCDWEFEVMGEPSPTPNADVPCVVAAYRSVYGKWPAGWPIRDSLIAVTRRPGNGKRPRH